MSSMIRQVTIEDAGAVAAIYNEYILNSVITFEIEAVSELEMAERIREISSRYPYFVYEVDGVVVGYCYAHAWKEKAAYRHTVETTVYLSPHFKRKGIGISLMQRLIEECRRRGFRVLIACITDGNEASNALHEKLGFRQVSHFSGVGEKFGRRLDVVDYELQLYP